MGDKNFDLICAKNPGVFHSWPEQRGTVRNSGLQKLFRKERVSQNTQTRFLPWEKESKGFALVIPQAAEHSWEPQHSPRRIHCNSSWLELGTSNGFLTNYRANNTTELLEKGGQAEQEGKFCGKGSALLMFNPGWSCSPVAVPGHGLSPGQRFLSPSGWLSPASGFSRSTRNGTSLQQLAKKQHCWRLKRICFHPVEAGSAACPG